MKIEALLLLSLLAWCVPVVQAQETKDGTVLTGQIACAKCWTEADRAVVPYGSAHDMECAVDCQKEGIGTVLAVTTEGQTTLYQLEFGKLKKTKKGWLEYTANQVEVSGTMHQQKGHRVFKVNTLKVLAKPVAQPPATVGEGTQAPELALPDLSGLPQSLSGYRGKIVVLNFWATWCGPCKQEMPVFVNAQNSYAAFGVQVIAAAADDVAKRDVVIKFVRENKLNFPVWLGVTTDNMTRFGVGPGLPATVIIDREGKIAALFRGPVTEAMVVKQLEALGATPVTSPAPQPTPDQTASNTKSSTVPS
ncbi:MAG: TlpA family protein disulfide reductase [Blastocatellia bacterium]|nr:TlpA family protein disulfide reductase [Blastocatellia bacterium]